jgi:toxin-antitoxin system PIN domain toxin
VIAVDTNILVYAHREESPGHAIARERLAELAESSAPWAIPWPCIHEFIGIVTRPRLFNPPTQMSAAIEAVEDLLASPSLVLLTETDGYWERLNGLLLSSHVAGAQVHDARIASLCLHHGVKELWTADRDFGRFPALRVRNPLVG